MMLNVITSAKSLFATQDNRFTRCGYIREWATLFCPSDSSSRNVGGSSLRICACQRTFSLLGPQIHLWLQSPCSFCLFPLCVSWLMVCSRFISPCLHRNIVLDETQCSLLKELSASALGKHKRKIISEHEFTNFLQNKLGKLCHQTLSISIPGTSAH